ncbi:MAG: DUF4407 domain-containing protein [Microbacterium sp.]|nr:DUF4407 domain-containing protein [Microbacterium sp.]
MSSSYSAHRPGRFGSDGRIELDGSEEDEPLYLSDVRDAERDRDGDELPEDPFEDEFLGADPDARTEPVPPDAGEDASAAAEPEPAAGDEPEPAAASAERRRAARRPRGPRLPLGRRLAVLGGADADVLADVPEETPRFVQMFFVLASTALVSAISMGFALTTGVRVAVWFAVPLAIVWALIIFNLDRFLTSTMRSTHRIGKLIGLAVPRVIMAALIGVVVAEPLVLQVFQNDIAREVTSTNLSQAVSDQKAVTDGPEKKALDAASARVSALENQAATGIVAGTSTTSAAAAAAQKTVDQLDEQVAAAQKTIDQARALYQCELTGQGAGTVPGCTGVVGSGASSDAAKAQLAAAQSAYDALAAKLTAAQAALAAANASGDAAVSASEARNKKQARDELPAARKTYDTALAVYDARAATVANGNADAVGLLSQITALDSLSKKEPTLAWAHWLIAALFFMIELLPVLVKVLTSYGDPSLYEKADALRRQVALDRVTARTWHERADIARGPA